MHCKLRRSCLPTKFYKYVAPTPNFPCRVWVMACFPGETFEVTVPPQEFLPGTLLDYTIGNVAIEAAIQACKDAGFAAVPN